MQSPYYPGQIATKLYTLFSEHPSLFARGWKLTLTVCIILLGLNAYATLKKSNNGSKPAIKLLSSDWLFLFIIVISALFLRMHTLVLTQLNVDETFWIVTATAWSKGGELWKDIIGTTSGPLVFVPLGIISKLGFELTYATTRLFAISICVIPTIVFTWKAISNFYSNSVAKLAIIPLLILLATGSHIDINSYNSEHIPMMLLAVSIYFLSLYYKKKGDWLWPLICMAILLGTIPYIKLQATPIALSIGLCCLAFIPKQKMFQSVKSNHLLPLLAASLLPTIVIIVSLTINDTLSLFGERYILDNISYAKNGISISNRPPMSALQKLAIPVKLIASDIYYQLFIATLFVPAIVFLFITKGKNVSFKKLAFTIIIIGSSYISVAVPGNAFMHYMLFILAPITMLAAFVINVIIHNAINNKLPAIFIVVYCACILITSYYVSRKMPAGIYYAQQANGYPIMPISEYILKYARNDDKITVWGWNDMYHLQTNLPYTYIASNSFYVTGVLDWQKNKEFDIYMTRMKAKRPLAFIDDVSKESFIFNTDRYKHENFQPLRDYIASNYTLVHSDGGKRLYILNERLSN